MQDIRRRALPLFVLSYATIIGTSSAVSAQSEGIDLSKLAGVQAELQDARTKEADLVDTIAKTAAAAKPLLEEHNAEIEQMKALAGQGAALQKAIKEQEAEAAKQRAATAQHNAACPHETADAALIKKCNAKMEQLNVWAGRIRTQIEQLAPSKEKYNKQVEETRQRDQNILAQLAEIRSKDANARSELAKVQDRIKLLGKSLNEGIARCAELENAPKEPGNAEALGYCHALAASTSENQAKPTTDSKP